MQEATKLLSGKRDWSCFRDSECQAKSPIKTIDKAEKKIERNIEKAERKNEKELEKAERKIQRELEKANRK